MQRRQEHLAWRILLHLKAVVSVILPRDHPSNCDLSRAKVLFPSGLTQETTKLEQELSGFVLFTLFIKVDLCLTLIGPVEN